MAAAKTGLRAVGSDEKAEPKKLTTVSQAVASGTRRDELVAMRARIAKAIDEPNIRGADLAALSRRLLEIGKEIEALDLAANEDSGGDSASPDEAFDAATV